MCQVYAGQRPESYEPVTRRLRLSGHSTSIRLERSFWRILDGMAAREGMTTPAFISRLHDEVQEIQGGARNFASLLRCACLIEMQQARDAGFALAAE
ncbi:ribbon-helix-helix domain-containing protein [Paracoccus sp. MC1854]|uniref:ribbon-helix-helix domain-containing protein n=1 Tax=Paracoccus sp. MC1854 TaxID=2760306 RepID=UPI0016045667|nr:ribbon-helix-helix domain-containing protein [Paracoccus sp. MC1854]MBB1492513.1 ribbon-helix-helix domain-containing protein [Paracoccus sp. MC1854]